MTTPYESVKDHLNQNEWKFEPLDDVKIIRTGFSGDHANLKFSIIIDEDDDLIQCITTYQTKVPPLFRGLVAELVCRANYGMKIGKFELDFSDGDLRFQTASAFLTGVLPDEVICRVLGTNLVIADKYYPAFMKVLFGGYTPEDAIDEVEQDLSKENDDTSETDEAREG